MISAHSNCSSDGAFYACHRLDVVGMPQHRHMSVDVVGLAPLRGSIDEGRANTRHASLSSLGSTNLSPSETETDELDESRGGGLQPVVNVAQSASG